MTSPFAPSPLPRTLTLSLLALAAIYCLVKPLATADLNVFMLMGRVMATQGGLADREVLAFAELGRPFINGTWLAQRLFYEIHRLGGYPWLVVLLALCVTSTLALTAHHGALKARSSAAGALAALWALVLALQNLGLRPQSFSMPLFAASFLIVDGYAHRRWAPAAMGLIYALWANLHGAFPSGLVVVAAVAGGHALRALSAGGVKAAWLDPDTRRVGLLGGVAVLSTFVGPYGPGIYQYVAQNSSMPSSRLLDEWLPAELFSFMGVRFYGAALVIGALGLIRRRLELHHWALLCAFGWLAAGSQRMILWWGLVSAPLVVMCIDWRAAPAPNPLHERMWQWALPFWAVMIALANPWVPRQDDWRVSAEGFSGLDRDTPVLAAELLAARPGGGRIFADMMWSGYLLWRLWPRYSTFVDPRIWVFQDQTWRDYVELSSGVDAEGGPDWQARLDRWGVDCLVLDPQRQAPLLARVRSSPGWRALCDTAGCTVWERRHVGEENHDP